MTPRHFPSGHDLVSIAAKVADCTPVRFMIRQFPFPLCSPVEAETFIDFRQIYTPGYDPQWKP